MNTKKQNVRKSARKRQSPAKSNSGDLRITSTSIATTTTTSTTTITTTSRKPSSSNKKGVATSTKKAFTTTTPTYFDVLCGRGVHMISHPGNKIFQNLVKSKKTFYQSAMCLRHQKRDIAKEIVNAVKNSGGRFLKRVSDELPHKEIWFEIDDKKAILKTGQALRERYGEDKNHLPYEKMVNLVSSGNGPSAKSNKSMGKNQTIPAATRTVCRETPSVASVKTVPCNWEWKLFDFAEEEGIKLNCQQLEDCFSPPEMQLQTSNSMGRMVSSSGLFGNSQPLSSRPSSNQQDNETQPIDGKNYIL